MRRGRRRGLYTFGAKSWATRPWQHVLDCVGGYLTLASALLARDETAATASISVPVLATMSAWVTF